MTTDSPVRRVLIVDDEDEIRSAMRQILAEEGYAVETVASGEEALAAIATRAPDLILLDVNLPGVDGWQVLDELRSAAGEQTPVVVMTAGYDIQAQALDNGAQGYLGKPFDLEDLIAAVGAHVGLPVRDAHEEVREPGTGNRE